MLNSFLEKFFTFLGAADEESAAIRMKFPTKIPVSSLNFFSRSLFHCASFSYYYHRTYMPTHLYLLRDTFMSNSIRCIDHVRHARIQFHVTWNFDSCFAPHMIDLWNSNHIKINVKVATSHKFMDTIWNHFFLLKSIFEYSYVFRS